MTKSHVGVYDCKHKPTSLNKWPTPIGCKSYSTPPTFNELHADFLGLNRDEIRPETPNLRTEKKHFTPQPVTQPHISKVNIPYSSLDDIPILKYEPQNLTATKDGFNLTKKQLDELNQLNSELHLSEQYYFANINAVGQPDRAADNSLVKRCISPTEENKHINEVLNEYQSTEVKINTNPENKDIQVSGVKLVLGEKALWSEKLGCNNGINLDTGEVVGATYSHTSTARILYRKWSDEYRLRIQSDTPPMKAPPPQDGDRFTNEITARGVRKIIESGAYLSAIGRGYTTFLTLTFKQEARKRIADGISTIGKEVSRFFDAVTKVWQRGFSCDNQVLRIHESGMQSIGAREIIDGHLNPNYEPDNKNTSKYLPLDYCWVAECPKNKAGELNPHCHILLNWTVEPHLFFDWAFRLESLWGLGFAKIEKIRNKNAASEYLLKALGYMTKREKRDQGEIKGNRYNISKSARAPDWELLSSYHAQHMAAIIAEVNEIMERKKAVLKGEISAIKYIAMKAKQSLSVLNNKREANKANQVRSRLKHIEQKLKAKRQKLVHCPVRTHEYQITIKGESLLKRFLSWAHGARMWNAVPKDNFIDEDQAAPVKQMGRLLKASRRIYRGLARKLEESNALWPKLLEETWRADHPTNHDDSFDFNEYEQWAGHYGGNGFN